MLQTLAEGLEEPLLTQTFTAILGTSVLTVCPRRLGQQPVSGLSHCAESPGALHPGCVTSSPRRERALRLSGGCQGSRTL